jgi:hypothetical protein
MDDETYKVLAKLKLRHAKLIQLESVENKVLRVVKKSRNKGEYSWTLKSSLMSYLFKKYPSIPNLFYLDADISFFKDVALVYNEIGSSSLAIAPHRFPPGYEARTKNTGIFNAGVVFIKRDPVGLNTLKRWTKQCIDWCYGKVEDGKLGDQMYLNEWPKLYKNVHQFQHPGINLAPWNVNVHKISNNGDFVYVDTYPLIFYHFHLLKIFTDLTFEPSYGYNISETPLNLIYKPYEKLIKSLINKLNLVDPNLKLQLEQKNIYRNGLQKVIRFLQPIYWKIKAILNN